MSKNDERAVTGAAAALGRPVVTAARYGRRGTVISTGGAMIGAIVAIAAARGGALPAALGAAAGYGIGYLVSQVVGRSAAPQVTLPAQVVLALTEGALHVLPRKRGKVLAPLLSLPLGTFTTAITPGRFSTRLTVLLPDGQEATVEALTFGANQGPRRAAEAIGAATRTTSA